MYNSIQKSLSGLSLKSDFIKTKQVISIVGNGTRNDGSMLFDSADGQFLKGGLEYIDPIVYKPLRRFHWYRDMPILPGGGAIEFASWYTAQYEAQSTNDNAISGSANVVTKINANFEKHISIVKAYAWATSLSWIDEMKMAQVGSSIPELQDEGVMLYYNQKLDNIAFFGMVDEGDADAFGLLNNTNISETPVTTEWVNETTPANEATPLEIFNDFNNFLLDIAEATAYDETKKPNHALFGSKVFTKLSQPMVIGTENTGLATSIIKYIKENMALKYMYDADGEDFMFFMNKYLTPSVGTNSRGVVYRYDRSVVRMPLPMDLTRGATMYNPTTLERLTTYVAFIGQVQFIYPNAIGYIGNIWTE